MEEPSRRQGTAVVPSNENHDTEVTAEIKDTEKQHDDNIVLQKPSSSNQLFSSSLSENGGSGGNQTTTSTIKQRIHSANQKINDKENLTVGTTATTAAATTKTSVRPDKNNDQDDTYIINGEEQEEMEEEELLALAKALSPSVENLIHQHVENLWNQSRDIIMTADELSSLEKQQQQQQQPEEEDDDNMQMELFHLKAAEQSLREELEFAGDLSYLFAGGPSTPPPTPPPQQGQQEGESQLAEDDFLLVDSFNQGDERARPRRRSRPYTLKDHAQRLDVQARQMDVGRFTCPVLIRQESTASATSSGIHGSNHGDAQQQQQQQELLQDCREFLRPLPTNLLQQWFFVGLHGNNTSTSNNVSKEGGNKNSHENWTEDWTEETSLPVRIIMVRIRPDVLCGAVMDALHGCVVGVGDGNDENEMGRGEVLKHQGGHFRAILPARKVEQSHYLNANSSELFGYGDNDVVDFSEGDNASVSSFSPLSPGLFGSRKKQHQRHSNQNQPLLLPALEIDAQLCTRKKSPECERILLIRIYSCRRSKHHPLQRQRSSLAVTAPASPMVMTRVQLERMHQQTEYLREAAALVQRMEWEGGDTAALIHPDEQEDNGDSSSNSNDDDLARAKERLMHTYKAQSSVVEKQNNRSSTLPALSEKDWPVVQSSWRFVDECLCDLRERQLTYSTLATTGFACFPALTTLDGHFCSQIRLLCRETMIRSLLKTAQGLEEFARESELSCATLIQTLKGTFAQYRLQPPALPKPVPLTAYPLDFVPPEVACPPWGQSVLEAMNMITAAEQDGGNDGLQRARDAVALVLAAFQKQDDEEQSARLGRKNLQVMDRLAKMQAYKRESIFRIRDAYGRNELATAAALEFHEKAKKAEEATADANPDDVQLNPLSDHLALELQARDQVPLLKCSIHVGAMKGTCWITASEMMLATHYIPLVGSSRHTVYRLEDIRLGVKETTASLLNPLPSGMSVHVYHRGVEVLSFVPSMGAEKFKSFVDIVQTVASENPENLKFSARGGMLYMYEDPVKSEITR